MATTLRRGSRGPEMERLQELLNRLLHPSPNPQKDGDFGARTEAAVRLYQASVGLGIDGVVGPRTWAALEKGLITNSAPAAPALPSQQEAPWMAVAMQQLGQREIPGARHNPHIVEYHTTTTLRATTDETAWCSSFVNWCLRQVGIAGTNSALAASWLEWGQAVSARAGAITVIYNASAANSSLSVSGNHVGFLVEETGTHFILLGGNQSNQVKISSYPKSSWQIKGYRWPNR
ncbi:MAG TPA: TIGR02594 family protein [Alphaproteobacteria bacterium]|nr:TIGR02594 family protein [Alphaproteobacteria bacterium]